MYSSPWGWSFNQKPVKDERLPLLVLVLWLNVAFWEEALVSIQKSLAPTVTVAMRQVDNVTLSQCQLLRVCGRVAVQRHHWRDKEMQLEQRQETGQYTAVAVARVEPTLAYMLTRAMLTNSILSHISSRSIVAADCTDCILGNISNRSINNNLIIDFSTFLQIMWLGVAIVNQWRREGTCDVIELFYIQGERRRQERNLQIYRNNSSSCEWYSLQVLRLLQVLHLLQVLRLLQVLHLL